MVLPTHTIISSLELTLSNAAALASLSGYTPEEEKIINQYVTSVINLFQDVDSLSDKDRITYLKLVIKFRDKKLYSFNVNDYVTQERQQLINMLQDNNGF